MKISGLLALFAIIGLIVGVATNSPYNVFAYDSSDEDKPTRDLEKVEKKEKIRIEVKDGKSHFKILKIEYKEKLHELKETYKEKLRLLLQ